MKTTLVALGLAVALASCSGDAKPGAAGTGATAAGEPAAGATVEASAATALADSVAKVPNANPADVAAAAAYAKAVADWYASDLSAGIKTHPLAEGIWKNYRYILRQVVASRPRKKVKPEDVAKWGDFTPQAEQVTKDMLLLTQDNPTPTSTAAVPRLQTDWDAMATVAHAVERHRMYLDYPETRDRR